MDVVVRSSSSVMSTEDNERSAEEVHEGSGYVVLLRRAVDTALDAPRSRRGTALAELSLSLGLVEEHLVSLARADGAAIRIQADEGASPQAAEHLLREIPSLLARLRTDASAAVPLEQVRTLSPRTTIATIANVLWRRSGSKDNNNTLHLQTVLSSLRTGELDCFGLATTTLISVALLMVTALAFNLSAAQLGCD